MSKSILSALVGAAFADGHIASLDQPVTDFVPELADAGFGEVTLEHLLQMTSGMDSPRTRQRGSTSLLCPVILGARAGLPPKPAVDHSG